MLAGGLNAVHPRACLSPAQLYEEHELIWDDRVAAEMTLDFDASFVPTEEVRKRAGTVSHLRCTSSSSTHA